MLGPSCATTNASYRIKKSECFKVPFHPEPSSPPLCDNLDYDDQGPAPQPPDTLFIPTELSMPATSPPVVMVVNFNRHCLRVLLLTPPLRIVAMSSVLLPCQLRMSHAVAAMTALALPRLLQRSPHRCSHNDILLVNASSLNT